MRKKLHLAWIIVFACTVLVACSAKTKTRIVVAADGSGDYKTIQEAIDAVSKTDQTVEIYIKNGIYKEKIIVPTEMDNVHFLGEDPEKTVITWDDYSGKDDINTFTSYTMQILGNDILVENLTIENSEGLRGQAVSLDVRGDRCTFKNCRIVGNQDTLYAAGKGTHQYYKNCHIEGTTDFIFGSATAVFKDCDILCKKNSYITAASTPQGSQFGYVFLNCKFSAAPGVGKVFLGRPWRDYANVVYLNCDFGDFIRPEGWHNWSKPEREKTAFYAEHHNTGAGADTAQRVAWSHQLTNLQAQKYTVGNILNLNQWKLK
ncbi:MAG TPA: pectinesterase family protein [Sunxiuqinia sp.]|nr:pectinesterase family protein [Sunxiuqinia sp.]